MKTLNSNAPSPVENKIESNSFAWDDVLIYDEMADQPSVRMNLLQQLKNQMAQLEEMTARRQFLTKEIMNYIVK